MESAGQRQCAALLRRPQRDQARGPAL